MSTVQGIKTVSTRLDQLEANLSTQSGLKPSFVLNIQKNEQQQQLKTTSQRYQDIVSRFIDDVNKYVTNPLSEVSKVVELAVHFVEDYSPLVSQLFGVVVKGNAKLEFAIELISKVIDCVDTFVNSEFLKNIIEHFVTIFNERKLLTAPNSQQQISKKKKKGFFKTIKGSIC